MSTARILKEQVSVLGQFSDERLERLVSGSEKATFEAGQAILRQGDEATHFGIILGGTVAASVEGDGGESRVLGRLEAGDTFNELSLMTGDTVLADFVAETRCEVLLVPVSLFQSVIVSEPSRHSSGKCSVQARSCAVRRS